MQFIILYIAYTENFRISLIGFNATCSGKTLQFLQMSSLQDMFKRLELAVPEVRLQFYSFSSVVQYEEQFFPDDWMDQTPVELQIRE